MLYYSFVIRPGQSHLSKVKCFLDVRVEELKACLFVWVDYQNIYFETDDQLYILNLSIDADFACL